MNITLAVDERLAREARAAARSMGKSLNQVVREHLETLAGAERAKPEIQELRDTAGTGDSRGHRFDRNAAYEDRLDTLARAAAREVGGEADGEA